MTATAVNQNVYYFLHINYLSFPKLFNKNIDDMLVYIPYIHKRIIYIYIITSLRILDNISYNNILYYIILRLSLLTHTGTGHLM